MSMLIFLTFLDLGFMVVYRYDCLIDVSDQSDTVQD